MPALRTKVPVRYKNPHASFDLTLELEVIENTPPEILEYQTRFNARTYSNWLTAKDEHALSAVFIGGGASINDHIEDIKKLESEGATIFAMNGSSKWAREHGINVDYQVILDAKEDSSFYVDGFAGEHLFASQCHPATTAAAENLTLWHLDRMEIEDYLPPERVKAGGYVIVGGDSSVGICSLCLAYTQGYRDLHVFGYDTSYRDGEGHGYKQNQNNTMPTMQTTWAGKEYTIALAMKDQCQGFMAYSEALKKGGCTFTVYGEGLLQSVYLTDAAKLSEKDKYRLMWMSPSYSEISPGAHMADYYMATFKPEGRIIDFGCGSGKASVRFKEAGLEPYLIDFADNCRDHTAGDLEFLEWDLTEEIPVETVYGFCADVMEHIPTKDVEKVIKNIMASAEQVYFQISTIDDHAGKAVGVILHHTVKPHKWWARLFKKLGYKVSFEQNMGIASGFYVSR